MKSGRKATILVSAMTILLSLCLLAGATYALFGQKVDRTVEITAGSVSAQVEFQEEIKTYSMDKPMTAGTFELGGTAILDRENALVMAGVMPGDKAEVVLNIKNTSSVKIKYRVKATLSGDLAAAFAVTVDGKALAGTENDTAITEWLEMEIDAEKGITLTVELPDEAGNDFMLKSGKAIFTVQIAQGNATDQELDNAFSE